MLVDYLKNRHGWHTWIAKPGVVPPDGRPDITLSGTVVAFGVEAVPGFGRTKLTVTSQIQVKALHAGDQESVALKLDNTEIQWGFWFERGNLEALVNTTVRKNMEQFMSHVTVDGRSLRMAPH